MVQPLINKITKKYSSTTDQQNHKKVQEVKMIQSPYKGMYEQ
jgi:hypothetical protein